MSVWKGTTYKLEVAKELYEILPEHISTILGENAAPYLSPATVLSPIQADTTWDEVAVICKWSDTIYSAECQDDFAEEYQHVKKWFVGTSALYQIIRAVQTGKFTTKAEYDYAWIDRTSDTFGQLIAHTTQVSPKVFYNAWKEEIAELIVAGRQFENASESFKHLRTAFINKTNDLIEIDQALYFGPGNRLYYGHIARHLCILKGSSIYTDRGLIFTRAHLNFLVEALMRLANIHYFLATEYVHDTVAAGCILRMVDMTITDASQAKAKNADKVVQAYHKARMYAQMLVFENEHTGAINEARAEFSTKGLLDLFNLDEYLALIEETPLNRRLDCLQVYKWMFPPDFDSTYAFSDLYSWHMATRPSGADINASDEMKENWRRVVDERKRNIASAYKAKCSSWATSDNNIACKPNNIDKWELHALFPYHTYGNDVVSQIKDKSTVAALIDDEIARKTTRVESSFLLWYMANAGSINTEDDAKALMGRSLAESNYARVAYKGEAHKPGSRLFFMAPPRQRILLGELEGNISDVAMFYPGSLQGKDAHQKAEMLQRLFDVYQAPPKVPSDELSTTYIVTFDLSKFSPKSNPNVTKDYHDFWATVFGYEAIKAMYQIGPDSSILHMQSGLVMYYQNQGADLEGFRGRMMTLFHADMLGAACRKAREEGYILGKAILAVFIDDGAVKVAAKGDGQEALENANNFLKVMQDIYAAAGQENHPNKTIVSRVGGELLAEQYLHSHRLKCPIKAAMRLYPDYENPATSLPEEFDALFAASQGAVKDQGLWVPTYKRYVIAALKSLLRWDRGVAVWVNPDELCIKLITPKSYGGFGVQPFQGLATTATLNLTAEGFGMLNRIARAEPAFRSLVHKIVTRQVMVRDALATLRNPTRVRADGVVLVENRLMMEIINELSKSGHIASAFMNGYRAEELRAHARAVGEALLNSDVINLTLMAKAWSCTPLAYVESVVSKFRRAKTIIDMLGYRAVGRVRNKNADDVKAVLRRSF